MKKIFTRELIMFLIITILLSNCASSSLDRSIKRKSKIIRESEIIVFANKSSVISNTNIYLRKYNVFDISISGVYWEYYSGTWMLQNDTLYLNYFNNHKPSFYSTYAYCDKENKEIVFIYKTHNFKQLVNFQYTGSFYY